MSLAGRLYRGEVSIDFIGRRRIWYAISGLVVLISIISLSVRGINPSIDFKGGAVFSFPAQGHSLSQVRSTFTAAGTTADVAQTVGEGRVRVETPDLSNAEVGKVQDALVQRFDIKRDSISVDTVGASWGSQITRKALTALVVFLIVVMLYLSMRYEWKMALAAMVALLHDLTVTAGIYSLTGLQVSPETVIALLTVLGYSLYDTVVVFDKVRENTAGLAGGSRITFSQATNLAVNQTLMRSINTTLISLFPVAGLLFIGAGLLGAGSLEDLSLALLIGLAAGGYSSIFLASPLLCDLKEREPQFQQLARRVAARQAKEERDGAPGSAGGGMEAALATSGGGDLSTRAPGATERRGQQRRNRSRAARSGKKRR